MRIGTKLFNEHFVLHKMQGSWVITNKSSVVVQLFD